MTNQMCLKYLDQVRLRAQYQAIYPLTCSILVKIEHDATLSMLIHRYMEYMLRTSQAFHILHLLRLNPQIYRHFPVEQHHWSSGAHILTKRMANGKEVQYITSVNPATTIKNYRDGGGPEMYLIFDRYDPRNRTIATGDTTYPLPDGYTTGWVLKTKSKSSNTSHAATLRINSEWLFNLVRFGHLKLDTGVRS